MFLSVLSSSAQTILRDFPTRQTSKQSCSFCKFVFANYLALLVQTLHQIWVCTVGGCSLSFTRHVKWKEESKEDVVSQRSSGTLPLHYLQDDGGSHAGNAATSCWSGVSVHQCSGTLEDIYFFLKAVYSVLPRAAPHVMSTQPLFICTCGCMEPIRTIISTTH